MATNSNWYSKERRAPPTRPKRHPSRPSMDIVAKFGQMGSGLGQFHSPHGFCLSPTEDIVVADTHNHRIQVLIWKKNYYFFLNNCLKLNYF